MNALDERRRLGWRLLIAALLCCLGLAGPHAAHAIRPDYLQIDQTGLGRYSVLWRTPLLSGMRLPVALRFSEDVRNVIEPAERRLPDSVVERRVIEPAGDLAGKRIE